MDSATTAVNDAGTARAVSSEQLRRIVDHARRAPSVHNTQPWRWQVSGSSLELWADRERALPVSDPLGRNLVISCGAALHHTVVAAAALGAEPVVDHLPDGPDSDLMARIALTPGTPTEKAIAELDHLRQRKTDRRRFTSWPVPEENLHHLAEAGAKWGATVLAVTDRELRLSVEDLLEDARRRQQADPRIAEETEAWIDHGREDGVPTQVLPQFEGARGERASRFGSGVMPGTAEPVIRGTDGLLVLSTVDDGTLSWLQTGASLSALWLQAAGNGLSIVPLSQLVEVAHTRVALQQLLEPPARVPQILVRVGWQEIGRDELPRTPRRMVDDVLG